MAFAARGGGAPAGAGGGGGRVGGEKGGGPRGGPPPPRRRRPPRCAGRGLRSRSGRTRGGGVPQRRIIRDRGRALTLVAGGSYTTEAMPFLPVGKLSAELLPRLFAKYVPADPRGIGGPQVGEDAAVLDMGDRYLVATTDPITFATDEMGWYALHVNANDLAVRGAPPPRVSAPHVP